MREHIIGESVERHDRRDGDRANQGEGELGEQRAGQAALEADRDVDRRSARRSWR